MDLYFERCDGTAATVEDFLACFAATSGRDLAQFKRWYTQAGTPRLTVRTAYDADARTFRVDVAQSLAPTPGQDSKLPMTMPIALGLVDRAGGDFVARLRRRATGRAGFGRLRARRPRSHASSSAMSRAGRRCRSCAAFPRRSRVDDDLTRGRSHRPLPARQRQFQPLAVAAESGDPHPHSRRRRHPRRRRAGAQRRLHRGLWRRARRRAGRPHRPRLRGAGDGAAERSRYRARDWRERRSGRDLRRARPSARRVSGARIGRSSPLSTTDLADAVALQPDRRASPAGARCATARFACWSAGDADRGGRAG